MKYVVLFAVLLMAACGKHPETIQGLTGNAGQNGATGIPGANGHSVIASTANTAPSCAAGGYTLIVATDMNDNQAIDAGDVISSAEICNGVNGTNGTNGSNGTNGTNGTNAAPTPFSPVAIENPCGDAPGVYDEVFLRLANGTLLASFSDNANGQNTRFSVLTPGSYQTTDGDHCSFTVDSSNAIINESHHN